MPQIVLLLIALTYVAGDTLTQLSKHQVLHPNRVIFTTTDVWYRSTSNETVRFHKSTTQTSKTPPMLLPYETSFLETTNSRVVMFAQDAPASTPFYWTDGVQIIKQLSIPAVYNKTSFTSMYHIASNNQSFALTVLQRVPLLRYDVVCTCLETGVTRNVTEHLDRLPSIENYGNVLYMIVINNGKGSLLRYSPHNNILEILDDWSETHPDALYSIHNTIMYQRGDTKKVRIFDIATSRVTDLVINATVRSIAPIGSETHKNQYIISTDDIRLSLICIDIATCRKVQIGTHSTALAYIPTEDTIVFTQLPFIDRIMYYNVAKDQLGTLYFNLLAEKSHTIFSFHYDSVSHQVLFITKVGDHKSVMQLYRYDVASTSFAFVTTLFNRTGDNINLQLDVQNGIRFTKEIGRSFHVFKLEVGSASIIPRIPKNSVRIGVIIVGGAVVVSFAIIIGLFIMKKNKNMKPSAQPYELVPH